MSEFLIGLNVGLVAGAIIGAAAIAGLVVWFVRNPENWWPRR